MNLPNHPDQMRSRSHDKTAAVLLIPVVLVALAWAIGGMILP